MWRIVDEASIGKQYRGVWGASDPLILKGTVAFPFVVESPANCSGISGEAPTSVTVSNRFFERLMPISFSLYKGS